MHILKETNDNLYDVYTIDWVVENLPTDISDEEQEKYIIQDVKDQSNGAVDFVKVWQVHGSGGGWPEISIAGQGEEFTNWFMYIYDADEDDLEIYLDDNLTKAQLKSQGFIDLSNFNFEKPKVIYYDDFYKYFQNKYNLKRNILYFDDTDIVCSEDDKARTLIDTYPKYLKNGKIYNPDELCEIVYKRLLKIFGETYLKELSKNKDSFSGPYSDLAETLNMEYANGYKYGLHSLFYRTAMSYANSFKYSDIFSALPASAIRNLDTICYNTIDDYKNKRGYNSPIKKIFVYKSNDNLLLICMPQYNFLTTIDILANDVKLSQNELKNMLFNKKPKKLESMIMHRDAKNEPKLMIAASKIKPGDIVYNDKNGHKLKVVNVDKGGFGRAKITFSDLDNNEKKITRLHDVRDMWELADDGDIAYKVDGEDLIIDESMKTSTYAERKILDAIKTSNSKYTLDDIEIEITPKGNLHIITKQGNDIVTLNRSMFSDSDMDNLYLNGYITFFDTDSDFIIDSYDKLNEITEYNKTPEITGTGYKVFKVKDGKLYPPMVANQNNESTPIGKWIEAEEGEFAGLSKTGRKQVKSIGSGTLSYRPGWHLGDIPLAKQFYRTNKETGEKEFPKDFIWAECEYVMDIDYQDEAMAQGITKSGKFQHSLAGLPKIPKDGYYKYRTNPNPDTVPWVITGAIKVNRLLDDYDVAEILQKHGIKAPNRQGGNKTLKELGF